MDLDPAGRFFDALPRVVGPPAFYEAHAQDAQPAQVVHPDARSRRQTWGGKRGAAKRSMRCCRPKSCTSCFTVIIHLLASVKLRGAM